MANWIVLEMQRRTSDGFVVEVISACEKTDAPGYARKTFYQEFEKVVGPGFIPYEELTQDVVIGWVKDKLGADVVLETESTVDAEALANKEYIENPPIKEGLPWE